MVNKQRILGTGAFLAMLVLTLDGKTAVQGAHDGVLLCIKTVIPSLFPFFMLSNLITSSYIGMPVRLLHTIGRVCRIPGGMESILIPAFLGGYPVGAQNIAQAWRQGQIPKTEAERLLGFCNNAGPSFLFGMAACLFPNAGAAWLLWGIQIVAALITARMLPEGNRYSGCILQRSVSLTDILKSAINAMASVCGWIILFRVVIEFMERWILWLLPVPAKVTTVGLLELANGCMRLFEIEDLRLRFVICSGMLAFGGLCVLMQIVSSIHGLSLKYFFCGKCLQTVLSILLAAGTAYGEPLLFLIPLVVFLRKPRKNGSIPVEAIV